MHDVCIRTDWHRKDSHHGGRLYERGQSRRHSPCSTGQSWFTLAALVACNSDFCGVQAIFERLSNENFIEHTVKASYLEIYNEDLADLLVAHGQVQSAPYVRRFSALTSVEPRAGREAAGVRGHTAARKGHLCAESERDGHQHRGGRVVAHAARAGAA